MTKFGGVFILIMITLAALYGISEKQKNNIDTPNKNNNYGDNIIYFKDNRTNLCFAAINSSGYYGYKTTSIACVPCDSIKSILINN